MLGPVIVCVGVHVLQHPNSTEMATLAASGIQAPVLVAYRSGSSHLERDEEEDDSTRAFSLAERRVTVTTGQSASGEPMELSKATLEW
jgi:hypothetical protein